MRRKDEWVFCSLLLAFLVLGLLYSVVNPLFESPDEIWHYAFVRHLATGGGLPVYKPGEEALFRQEGFQPPLYYILGALATSWVDTSDMESVIHPNPHAAIGYPGANGNKNAFLHSEGERFPYRKTPLAVHIVRLVSLLLGAVTVIATYLTARELFPTEKAMALGAAALVAFNPQFLFIHSAVNNDNAVTALSAVVLLLGILLLTRGVSTPRLVGLGMILGLALIAKLNALPLLVWTLVALACSTFLVRHSRSQVPCFLRRLALVFGLALLVGGWWYLRNWLLYSDPLAMEVWYGALGTSGYPTTPLFDLRPQLGGLELSFWAVFGWMNVLADEGVYNVIRLVDRLAVLGLVFFVIMGWRKRRPSISTLWGIGLLGFWFLLNVAMLLRYMQIVKAAQGRLLFPAISAISLLLFLGLAQFVPRRYTGALAAVVGVGMFLLAAITPFRYIAPAYARPPTLSALELENAPRQLNVTFGDCMKLLGYEPVATTIQAGQTLTVTLYWQATCPIDRNHSVFVHLLDDFESVVAQEDTVPGYGLFPTTQWQPGDAIADTYFLQIPATTIASSSAQLEAGMYDFSSRERLTAYSAGGESLGDQVRFASLGIESKAEPPHPVGVFFDFDSVLALVAYDFNQLFVSPGQEIELTLFWRMLAETEEDYRVIARLIGKGGQPLLEDARRLQYNNLPTSALGSGQFLEDKHVLAIPPECTEPDIYELRLSVCSLVTGQCLTIVEPGGESSTELSLVRIRIAK